MKVDIMIGDELMVWRGPWRNRLPIPGERIVINGLAFGSAEDARVSGEGKTEFEVLEVVWEIQADYDSDPDATIWVRLGVESEQEFKFRPLRPRT